MEGVLIGSQRIPEGIMTINSFRRVMRGAVAPSLVAVLFLGACGSSSGDDETSDTQASAETTVPSDAGAASTAAEGDAPVIEEDDTPIFSESEFAPVCRGTGQVKATAFDQESELSPLVVLSGEDPEYSFSVAQLPDGWTTAFETYEDTQLVACLARVAAEAVELCEGYEDTDSGIEWSVQTHDTTWEVTLREATTAEVVAQETFEVPASGCPMFSSYTEGDPDPVMNYDEPSADLEVFLKPFVN